MSLAGDLRFQDFEIVKTLGKGAAGIAELARQKADGQLICLKVIEGAAVNASQNQEVLAEIKVLEKLQHTHVIAYIGCFEHAAALYVAMEYAEGGDLEKLWQDAQKRKRPFEEERVLEWGHQISQALQYVHSMKVLHRDLKLANVLLDKDQRVKLGDFGLARTLGTQSYLAQTMCGTPYYISPELCKSEPYGAKSDVWALGCMLYELLTLKRPFTGTSLHKVVLKICTAEPPLMLDRSKVCSSLVKSCLKKVSAERPTAAELVQHFISGSAPGNETQPAQPVSPGRKLSAVQRMNSSPHRSSPRINLNCDESPPEQAKEEKNNGTCDCAMM